MANQHSPKHSHASRGKESRTYRSWGSMKTRCDNPNAPNYYRYGGRGISYDQRWAEFENFLIDMGERPEGTSLDRKDNDGNYCKDNCKWSTPTEQNSNTSTSTLVEYEGKKVTISELSRLTGIARTVLQQRNAKGQELLKPVKKYNRASSIRSNKE